MKKNSKIRELVTTGVFLVIYIITMFITGLVGLVPIMYFMWPAIFGIFAGPIMMLYLEKVQKPWYLLIFGAITPLIMVLFGHTLALLPIAFAPIIIAELIRRLGKFKSIKFNVAATTIFNAWLCATFMQFFLFKDRYIELCTKEMGEKYTDELVKLFSVQIIPLVYLGAIVGGFIGALLGVLLLKKHFKKANIA
ncbi:MAG: MptD family putative ECF transporter S component [Bacillales bacterium]